jgi:dUTP pyrophosphatase
VTELRFQRLDPAAVVPAPARPGDAGLDLVSVEEATIGPGERVAVGTGLAVAIPPGHAGFVQPRSGLAMRHGVTVLNSPGLIDPGYRGELRVVLVNTDPSVPFRVSAGDRIAQLVVVALAPLEPVVVEELEGTERGAAGFGSSGLR